MSRNNETIRWTAAVAKPSRSSHNISPHVKVPHRTSLGRAAAGLRHSRGPVPLGCGRRAERGHSCPTPLGFGRGFLSRRDTGREFQTPEGWPVYSEDRTNIHNFFLFFGGACQGDWRHRSNSRHVFGVEWPFHIRAAEKRKEIYLVGSVVYKQ